MNIFNLIVNSEKRIKTLKVRISLLEAANNILRHRIKVYTRQSTLRLLGVHIIVKPLHNYVTNKTTYVSSILITSKPNRLIKSPQKDYYTDALKWAVDTGFKILENGNNQT